MDGLWATVGSTNVDNRSFALNDELNVALYDGGMAAGLEKVFIDDLAALAAGGRGAVAVARAR